MRGKSLQHEEELFASYVHGRIHAEIQAISGGSPIPYEQLAISVAYFLLRTTSGGIMGAINSLSPLRGEATEGDTPAREVEVARRPYRRHAPQKKARRKMSKEAKAKISAAQKKIWAARKRAA